MGALEKAFLRYETVSAIAMLAAGMILFMAASYRVFGEMNPVFD